MCIKSSISLFLIPLAIFIVSAHLTDIYLMVSFSPFCSVYVDCCQMYKWPMKKWVHYRAYSNIYGNMHTKINVHLFCVVIMGMLWSKGLADKHLTIYKWDGVVGGIGTKCTLLPPQINISKKSLSKLIFQTMYFILIRLFRVLRLEICGLDLSQTFTMVKNVPLFKFKGSCMTCIGKILYAQQFT